MKYKQIELENGTVYLLPIPDMGSEEPMAIEDRIILELATKLEKLTSEHSSEFIECLESLNQLSNTEREDIFAEFCTHCGSANSRCQCWNEE